MKCFDLFLKYEFSQSVHLFSDIKFCLSVMKWTFENIDLILVFGLDIDACPIAISSTHPQSTLLYTNHIDNTSFQMECVLLLLLLLVCIAELIYEMWIDSLNHSDNHCCASNKTNTFEVKYQLLSQIGNSFIQLHW